VYNIYIFGDCPIHEPQGEFNREFACKPRGNILVKSTQIRWLLRLSDVEAEPYEPALGFQIRDPDLLLDPDPESSPPYPDPDPALVMYIYQVTVSNKMFLTNFFKTVMI
jgi:hypothetical protein